jgi:erythronate-4-phosphate dehydrogenase
MKTIVAESVLSGAEAFATLGAVCVRPDRAIGPADVRDADALVVRSKTAVNAALLDGARLAFVGTATAGYDHFDLPALADRGVAWTAAPGCNATSVAEYIVSALLALAARENRPLEGRTLGIVGVGQVGSRVARRAQALGMIPLLNDPPRALAEGADGFLPLAELLPRADYITLHVPLEDAGPFPTRRLADARFFAGLRPGAVFLNASRGEVVDEDALRLALASGTIERAVLDVWDHEPDADPALVEAVAFATPHIAGYSWDGKLAGTRQVYEAACRFFEVEPRWTPPAGGVEAPAPVVRADLSAPALSRDERLWRVVREVYDIGRDDRDFRAPELDRAARARRFERLRKSYWPRREFAAADLSALRLAPAETDLLRALGFRC